MQQARRSRDSDVMMNLILRRTARPTAKSILRKRTAFSCSPSVLPPWYILLPASAGREKATPETNEGRTTPDDGTFARHSTVGNLLLFTAKKESDQTKVCRTPHPHDPSLVTVPQAANGKPQAAGLSAPPSDVNGVLQSQCSMSLHRTKVLFSVFPCQLQKSLF